MLAGNLLKWLKKQHKTSIKLHHSLYTLSIITIETTIDICHHIHEGDSTSEIISLIGNHQLSSPFFNRFIGGYTKVQIISFDRPIKIPA